MTVFEILNGLTHYLKNHQIENPRLNAELLLAYSLHLDREGVYVHLHHPLKEKEKEELERLMRRRISGEPLQYILGNQEFWSIDFKVDPRVLIPRPETELLVEQALLILSDTHFQKRPSVLEIGTGSGALAISLAKEVKEIFLVATDISGEALMLAKENAKSVGVLHQIKFVNGDLFGPFCPYGKTFDLILSNPPYITRIEINGLNREVKDHEPIIALDGGEDGLDFYRRISSQAHSYLRKGGWLLMEVGQGQGRKVSEMIERGGHFSLPELIKDFSGIERVVRTSCKERSS
jgi:release factor glutamine methyltransferase